MEIKLKFVPIILLAFVISVSGCVGQSNPVPQSMDKTVAAINFKINELSPESVKDFDNTNMSHAYARVFREHAVDGRRITWGNLPLATSIIEIDDQEVLDERWNSYLDDLESETRNAAELGGLYTRSSERIYGEDVTKLSLVASTLISDLRVLIYVWKDGRFVFVFTDIIDVKDAGEETPPDDIVKEIIQKYERA